MKGFIATVSILIILFVGAWALKEHEREKNYQLQQGMVKIDQEFDATNRAIAAETMAAQIKIVRLTFGDLAAKTYELCHTYPPTQDENKRKCKALDERVAKAEAKQPKW